ncbi:hypothetical protein [Moorena producens]
MRYTGFFSSALFPAPKSLLPSPSIPIKNIARSFNSGQINKLH